MFATVIRVFRQIIRNPINSTLALFTTPFVLILYKTASLYSQESEAFPDFQTFFGKILILSLIMNIFPVAMAITEERESQSILHLRLAGMNSWEILIATSIPFYFLGILNAFFSLGIGILMGVSWESSILLVGGILIGLKPLVVIGLLIGSCANNSLQSFFIASLVMFIMIVFSGVLFPIPDIELLSISGIIVDLFVFLPSGSLQIILNSSLNSDSLLSTQNIILRFSFIVLFTWIYFILAIFIYEKSESHFLENSI